MTTVAATVDQKNVTEVGDPGSAPATVVAEVNAKEVAAVGGLRGYAGEMCRVELLRAQLTCNFFPGRRPALLCLYI